MEEIMEDGITYAQQKESAPNSCEGCTFYEEEYCTATRKFYSLCTYCKTIWVKKEVEVNTEPVKDSIKDESVTKPGVKHDQEKERYDLVPVLALEEVAKVLTAGAMKYNEDYEEENWRKVPNATRRYFSAAQRHLAQVRKGQTHDQETKLHHYAHAITNLMFLLEKELEITKD